ncbi:MAG: glycosyltransferase [Anaerolineaceae bacterium]|nr:glycosyltransferase [Anaerolineaceae bacterium]
MKRVLFLMSDTGGGHRAAAEAIQAALLRRYQGQVTTELVDVFRSYSPFPLKYMPEMYPWIINRSKSSWNVGYRLTNSHRRAKLLSRGMYVSMEKGLKRLLREHPADVIVCVHSVINTPAIQALLRFEERPPFVTVVTDLVSTHMFWYDRRVDRCLVPSQPAYDRGLESGLKPSQLRVTGLPVHPNFAERLVSKAEARKSLGWDPDLPAVLMVGGGEGMGPLYKTARAINDRNLKHQMAIIAGRNELLKAKLEADEWNQPMHIYPFVTNMPTLMAAADILVTKAGPATISEACIAGLPLILSDAIPGQETGNVELVVDNEAGVFAPGPENVADAVQEWLAGGQAELQRRSEMALRLAHPDAVWQIVDEVWHYAQQPPIATHRRSPALAGLVPPKWL